MTTTLLLILAWAMAVQAEDPLQKVLKDTNVGKHWIYHDLDRGRAEAKKTGKPLLVLFRCVPCDCATVLDEQVVKPGSLLEENLEKFVCVRMVELKGVDLNLFPFDRDLSFAVFFLNADGTIYGRYGTRATVSRTLMSHISLGSFRRALVRALELHEGYPANKEALAAKHSPPTKYQFAEEMPHLKKVVSMATTRQNCVHCHTAGEGELRQLRESGKLTARDLWMYPLPENVGLVLDVDDGLTLKSVRSGSAAEKAGLKPGDDLRTMNGQPLISQGDVQWVLHHLPDGAKLPVTFRRGGETLRATLAPEGNWRRTDLSWRESLSGLRPGMHTRPVSNGEKQQKGIALDRLGLGVRYVRDEAARAGLRSGDVIVAVDGKTEPMGEGEFLAYLRLDPAPEKVALKVIRGKEEREVLLPLR